MGAGGSAEGTELLLVGVCWWPMVAVCDDSTDERGSAALRTWVLGRMVS